MFEHLSHIDPQVWPGIAHVPGGRARAHKAKLAESRFAAMCTKAGIALVAEVDEHVEPAQMASMRIDHDALFARISDCGWLGLAESYMAEEWTSPDIAMVLEALIQVGYKPKTTRSLFKTKHKTPAPPGELPDNLVQLYGGAYTGLFATGISTTLREAIKSYSPGAGKGNEPARHYVDITTITDPLEVDRDDLPNAQLRAIDSLLDLAHVESGSDVLEWPLSGSALIGAIQDRGAVVDSLTTDPDRARAIGARCGDAANIHVVDSAIPSRHQWRGRYDAVISVDRFEVLGEVGAVPFIKTVERLLGSGGSAVIQTVVATRPLDPVVLEALRPIQAYIWPTLHFHTIDEIHRLVDRHSTMRVVTEKHLGGHFTETLRLKREIFEGHSNQAAALGYDRVYRRLWVYYFALLEALCEMGLIEMVQLELKGRRKAY
ncbi:MAG: class I SAM-dependent methyltransferase [Corynebacterium sp.]|nr:class I SAM-dependent methyltransferase [Corynebacterium sp.]